MDLTELPPFVWLSAEAWLALGTWILAGITFGLVVGALHHVGAIREENKKLSTLQICNCYDTNPVIAGAVDILWQARLSEDLERNPKRYRPQLVILLNYLDGIAIGIEQGLYIEGTTWRRLLPSTSGAILSLES
jgi:hypothetical protein